MKTSTVALLGVFLLSLAVYTALESRKGGGTQSSLSESSSPTPTPAPQTTSSATSVELVRTPDESTAQTVIFRDEIRVDVRPFTQPISTFVYLRNDGTLHAVDYSPYQLTVRAVFRGVVRNPELQGLLDRTRSEEFRTALARRDFGGVGLSRGDQFRLLVRSGSSPEQECFGFLEDAPTTVRSFVQDLLGIVEQMNTERPSDAYVRLEALPANRYDELRREGRLRFISILDLPLQAREVVAAATKQPYEFFPLSGAQRDALIAIGHQFFVVQDGSAYELTVFRSGVTPGTNR